MATIGKGSMDIEYLEGDKLDDVMRITEKPNVPSEELMIVLDSNGNEITFDKALFILNKYSEPLFQFNQKQEQENLHMRKTFEEKYAEKLKDKISGVEFTESSLSETISDIKNGVDHLNDIGLVYGPEESKFREWLKKEVENGLTDFRIMPCIESINCNEDGSLNIDYVKFNKNKEDLFKEINDMNEAYATGKYTTFVDIDESFINEL